MPDPTLLPQCGRCDVTSLCHRCLPPRDPLSRRRPGAPPPGPLPARSIPAAEVPCCHRHPTCPATEMATDDKADAMLAWEEGARLHLPAVSRVHAEEMPPSTFVSPRRTRSAMAASSSSQEKMLARVDPHAVVGQLGRGRGISSDGSHECSASWPLAMEEEGGRENIGVTHEWERGRQNREDARWSRCSGGPSICMRRKKIGVGVARLYA